MKISNETKVGSLTAIAIVTLILGFNFLKGKDLASANKDELFATFPDIKGLLVNDAVLINGLQVGKVSAADTKDANVSAIIVTIKLSKHLNIPANSTATIASSLLGSKTIEIKLGNATTYLKDGDTLNTSKAVELKEELLAAVNPALVSVNKTLVSLDTLVRNLNSVLDPNTKNNLQGIIANLTRSTKSLELLLNTQTGMLAKTLGNMEAVTNNLVKNNDKITSTINNLDKATGQLANAKIEESIASLQRTLSKLEAAVEKTNSKNNSLGALLNDRQLYDEIRQTNRSLTTLLDDLRVHPKRYVNISVFGRKDKKGPLKAPIYDSTSIKGNQ